LTSRELEKPVPSVWLKPSGWPVNTGRVF